MSDSPRSLASFGVAGLLSSQAEIFYTNDLRARNVGRVSDLISAKFRDTEIDELRVRALLVHGLFQSYVLRGLPTRQNEEVLPIAIEVGTDGSAVAVALSFHWEVDRAPNWTDLEARINQGLALDAFEKGLEWIGKLCSQLLVRYEENERRIEVVARMDSDASLGSAVQAQIVRVESGTPSDLEVSSYTELGDLDFSTLLRNPAKSDSSSISGEPGLEEELAQIFAATNVETETTEHRFVGDGNPEVESVNEVREAYEATVEDLRKTIKALESKLSASSREKRFDAVKSDNSSEAILVKEEEKEKTADDWGLHFLKQVWPFGKKEEDGAVVVKGQKEEVPNDRVVANRNVSSDPSGEEASDGVTPTTAEIESEEALRVLQEIAKTTKTKVIESTLAEINEEVEPSKAKRWVDTLSSEILQEKAKLSELQKNLAKQMRQRELEFKTSERALKQELKRRDDMVNQRQAAIENKNEQIAQLNLAVERASSATNDKESQVMKVKLDRAQRMAQMKEDEAKAMLVKVRDLENRLIIAQAKAQKGNDLQAATKMQNLEKKVEEYKRINTRLMESLNSQKEKSSDKEVGDLRRKLDQLDRMNVEAKRNLEKSAFKLREAQESERKLQTDLARAVEENRTLRKQSTRGSGESGGQAA